MQSKLIPLLLLIIMVGGCSQSGSKATTSFSHKDSVGNAAWTPPDAGVVIDRVREKITEDKLNDLYFTIKIITTTTSPNGVYLLKMDYGYAKNETKITFPKWSNGHYPKPVLKKDKNPYSVQLGFDVGDGRFHPFYRILATENSLQLKQTHAYYRSF